MNHACGCGPRERGFSLLMALVTMTILSGAILFFVRTTERARASYQDGVRRTDAGTAMHLLALQLQELGNKDFLTAVARRHPGLRSCMTACLSPCESETFAAALVDPFEPQRILARAPSVAGNPGTSASEDVAGRYTQKGEACPRSERKARSFAKSCPLAAETSFRLRCATNRTPALLRVEIRVTDEDGTGTSHTKGASSRVLTRVLFVNLEG